jgi:hypothetical protein
MNKILRKNIMFLLFSIIFQIKTTNSALQSADICFRNKDTNEVCGGLWLHECGNNYCMRDKNVCKSFNEIEKVVQLNQM